MKTHQTIEAARAAAKENSAIRCIAEIEHATEGRCFIGLKAPMASFAVALRGKPMPEIKQLVAEHPVLTAAESAAAREKALREGTTCERCGVQIDGNAAYSQEEPYRGMRVVAFYCDSCRELLSAIGQGEYTALQERAAARHSHEPYTKEDM